MSLLTLAYNQDNQQIDLQTSPDARLNWLQNAVLISLFTDARCEADELPQGETDQRGYWGDLDLPEGESLGSKLWLLRREKITQNTLNRARDYATDALQWLIENDHLQGVKVEVSRGGLERIDLLIHCQLPDGTWIELFQEYVLGASEYV
jgi:phage gp46-like protein